MRRVYYIFILRRMRHPVVIHSLVMLTCLAALSRVVSIPDVFSNMLEVKVGELAIFWVGAFSNTGVVTLVLVAAIITALLSLPLRLKYYETEELVFR